jgi:DNA-binding GntR family transcriptional regulator
LVVFDEQSSSMTRDEAFATRLGETAYQRLRDMILQGVLPAGTALQEKRLTESLQVSRTPVREAIVRLISDGLVVREGGMFPVVRRLSVDELIEVLHVRRLLEVDAAARAAEKGFVPELIQLREKFVRYRDDPDTDYAEQLEADEALHALLARQTGSKLLADMVQDLRMKTRIFDAHRVPERLRAGSIEHIEIVDAVADRDAERAKEAMKNHIDNVRSSVLAHLRRLF